ncbi:hypothetical protein [Limobrevibacterium gyesilva]|uniref:Lipoprotein n=1 Tax=Limobrevibacterium gyesilva TaxID=2991712 RepID=A0AA41YP01_9PROT|nr:hypothetical protein [Limobrevibacterium gyesilva]MCW3476036.1 hypothetical protein [Limobrevibacterium gyesilva]
MFSRLALFLLLGLLAGCGSLPRPFEGNPGATALRLAQPPPARLAVPAPGTAFLTDAASDSLARNLAAALVDQEVPAVADAPGRTDWRLIITAETRGETIVPGYTVQDPAGVDQGATEGLPISAASWAAAAPATLKQAAADAAPRVASLLTHIEAARRQSDPNSLVNRPARVAFTGVTGAPGDGNQSLTRQIRDQLSKLGQVLQDTDQGADFTLVGEVKTAPIAGGQMRVEIQWLVKDARGAEAGRVVQLNEVPRGTLDGYWGDIALVVAQEAAGGVRDVIVNQGGAKR